MITRGVSDIKGLHSLTTAVGPLTERKGFLKLYQLAGEKDNLGKRLEWAMRQKSQTEERLSEITHTMHIIEERMKRELISDPYAKFRGQFSQYY